MKTIDGEEVKAAAKARAKPKSKSVAKAKAKTAIKVIAKVDKKKPAKVIAKVDKKEPRVLNTSRHCTLSRAHHRAYSKALRDGVSKKKALECGVLAHHQAGLEFDEAARMLALTA